ncbi:MAG: PfkB family carbohydrate kinase [Gordonia sp. (in: high G+C Gram-positive bacteria)]|uniref:PfkB family carbohydrate kinase n=1 Tax=Gordonia sp. (in: high G+C Gram-positive bacteria) TaxID=84139 RepID=UPI0039E3FB15
MNTGIAVIGESLVDVVDGRPHVGGSPLNVAVGLARLGLPTTLHTRIGDDDHGRLIVERLRASGVRTAPGTVDGGRTSTAVATLDEHGQADYEFDLDWSIAAPETGPVRVVHTGSIGAIREPGGTVARAAVRAAGPTVLRSFDPNIRPAVMGSPAEVVARVRALAADCHVVKLSDDDAAWLGAAADAAADGGAETARSADDVLREIAAAGVPFAVMTRGADGCTALVGGVRHDVPGRRVEVADTIGAGDAFMAGLLYALIAGEHDRRLVDGTPLSSAQVRQVLETAVAVASITVSRPGADPPTSAELAAPR